MLKFNTKNIESHSGIYLLLVAAAAVFGFMSCSGGADKTDLGTPEGVVNSFVNRILEEGDLRGAYDLLTESDRMTIMQNEMARKYLKNEKDSLIEAYNDFYQEMLPDIIKAANKLIKVHARSPEIHGDQAEVGLEISYPADYTSLYFAGLSFMNKLSLKMGDRRFEEMPKEEQEKLLWSVKNDFNNTVEAIQVDKYSTYIFPVKVIREDGNWRINLELAARGSNFAF